MVYDSSKTSAEDNGPPDEYQHECATIVTPLWPSTVLSDLDPRPGLQLRVLLDTTGDLTVDDLSMAHGYQFRGLFNIRSSTQLGSEQTITMSGPGLSEEVSRLRHSSSRPLDPQSIEVMESQFPWLNMLPYAPEDQGAIVAVCDIQIMIQNNQSPEMSGVLWRWIKPQSMYAKRGPWESSINKAIKDGVWNAGKDFTIVARYVSSSEMEDFENAAIEGSKLFRTKYET